MSNITCQSSDNPFSLLDPHELAGSLLVASYFNWALMGVLGLQVYTYYLEFPKDPKRIKALVSGVILVEVAQTAIVSRDVHASLAAGYGCLDVLNNTMLYWFSIPMAGGIVGGIGQLYFALRMWKMSADGSKAAPVIISILAVCSMVASLVGAAFFAQDTAFQVLVTHTSTSKSLPAIGVWNGLGAICDITIALSMPYYLMRHGTGFRSTHVMIIKLVGLIIETGILTAIVAILHLCLYFSGLPEFLIPGIIVSKVYANTMLVLLNRRKQLRNDIAQDNTDINISLSSPGSGSRLETSAGRSMRRNTGGNIVMGKHTMLIRMGDYAREPEPIKFCPVAEGEKIVEESEVVSAHKAITIPVNYVEAGRTGRDGV